MINDLKNSNENLSLSETIEKSGDIPVGYGFEGELDEVNEEISENNPPSNDDLLQTSFKNMPELVETEKPREYKPKNPTTTPSYFPQEPPRCFEDPSFYPKFKPDTLFFIFYYQQGTYQQYLAAKDLKNRSWRYHKTFTTWFQRHEVPEDLTPDYERGTYIYFDYETGWCQRMRSKFTFEYKFLEDGQSI